MQRSSSRISNTSSFFPYSSSSAFSSSTSPSHSSLFSSVSSNPRGCFSSSSCSSYLSSLPSFSSSSSVFSSSSSNFVCSSSSRQVSFSVPSVEEAFDENTSCSLASSSFLSQSLCSSSPSRRAYQVGVCTGEPPTGAPLSSASSFSSSCFSSPYLSSEFENNNLLRTCRSVYRPLDSSPSLPPPHASPLRPFPLRLAMQGLKQPGGQAATGYRKSPIPSFADIFTKGRENRQTKNKHLISMIEEEEEEGSTEEKEEGKFNNTKEKEKDKIKVNKYDDTTMRSNDEFIYGGHHGENTDVNINKKEKKYNLSPSSTFLNNQNSSCLPSQARQQENLLSAFASNFSFSNICSNSNSDSNCNNSSIKTLNYNNKSMFISPSASPSFSPFSLSPPSFSSSNLHLSASPPCFLLSSPLGRKIPRKSYGQHPQTAYSVSPPTLSPIRNISLAQLNKQEKQRAEEEETEVREEGKRTKEEERKGRFHDDADVYFQKNSIDTFQNGAEEERENVDNFFVKDEVSKSFAEQMFIKFMAQLAENVARNFYFFHTNLCTFQRSTSENDDYIDMLLEKYSFRYRDISIYTLNELVERNMHHLVANEVEDLREAIKFYDMQHILFVCPGEKLPTNLLQWWLMWYEEEAGNSTEKMQDELREQINLLLDGDDTQIPHINSHLCRLLCRCRFDVWTENVKRIVQGDARVKDFLDAVEVGASALKAGLEDSHTLQRNAYLDGLKLLEQSIRLISEYRDEYPALEKSILLLGGDLSVTKVCSCDFKEHFISRVFWCYLKEPVDINCHWRLFIEDEGMLWKDKRISSLDKILITLWDSKPQIRPLKMIEIMQDGRMEDEFPSYIYPHIIDVLFLNGSIAQLPDSGAAYRAKVLLKYGKTLLSFGEENVGWMYIKEAERHPSTHADILLLLQECIEESESYESFVSFEIKLKNLNLFSSDQNKQNLFILDFAKKRATELVGKGKMNLAESIKHALHFEKYVSIIYKDSVQNNGFFISDLLNDYIKENPKHWLEILEVFRENWKVFDEIFMGKHVKSKLFSFFRKYCRILPTIQVFKEKMNENVAIETKLEWILQNREILRGVVYLLFRMSGLKYIPKYTLPTLFRQAIIFMQGVEHKGVEHIISQEDLREVWTAYRTFKNSLHSELNQNEYRSIDEQMSISVMKCKTKVLSQNSLQLGGMQNILSYIENL